jgi:hypothetical protein
MEDLHNSTFDTEFDLSLKSFSGSTISKADNTAGTKTCTPSRSRRNKSAEFDKILASVSPHSFA